MHWPAPWLSIICQGAVGGGGGAELKLTINVPVVYMGRYKVVLRADYP